MFKDFELPESNMAGDDDFWEYKEDDSSTEDVSEEGDESTGDEYLINRDAGFDVLEDDATLEDETKDEPTGEADAKPPEEGAKSAGTEDANALKEQLEKVFGDVISVVGDGTKLKIKGSEYDLKDLSKEEVVAFLQKGMYADQSFQENAAMRRELEEKERLLEHGAKTVQDLISRNTKSGASETDVAALLKPSEYDTAEVSALKTVASTLHGEINNLKTGYNDVRTASARDQMLNEIKTLQEEFPAASIDEVIAIKSMYPDTKISTIMENSNKYYSSGNFIERAINANPTFKREMEQKIIQAYNEKKGKSGSIRQMPKSSSGDGRVSTPKNKPIRGFDDADTRAMEYLKDLQRSRNE